MKKLKLLFMLCLSMFFAIGKKPFPLPCGNIFNALIGNLQANNQGIPPFFGNSLNFGSNTAQTLFNGRMGIYNLLKTQAVNSASLQGAAAFMAANVNSALGSFFKTDSLAATNDTSKVSTAKTQNAILVPSINTEQTQKDYNAIYYNYALYGTLNPQEINDLTNLAQLCPFTDGSAVYQARALLTRFDTTEYSNPCEYDVTSGSRLMSNNTSVNSDVEALNTLVYPNPASNILNVSTRIEGATISIYSITGQVVIQEKLNLLTAINIEKLSNGTYLYKITDANKQTIKTDKLLINK